MKTTSGLCPASRPSPHAVSRKNDTKNETVQIPVLKNNYYKSNRYFFHIFGIVDARISCGATNLFPNPVLVPLEPPATYSETKQTKMAYMIYSSNMDTILQVCLFWMDGAPRPMKNHAPGAVTSRSMYFYF